MELEEWEDELDYKGGTILNKPQIPKLPSEIFACQALHAKIAGHVCVRRQRAAVRVRGKERPDWRYAPCSTGKCHQGRLILREEWTQDLVPLTRKPSGDDE